MARATPHMTRTRRHPSASGRPHECLLGAHALDSRVDVNLSELARVGDTYPFRANDYYLRLIDWEDPHDPIRRLVVPSPSELTEFGSLDASNEAANTKARGLQHKYADTVVLLVTDQCAGFCRYCFRKRLFEPGSRETNLDVDEHVTYISEHPGVTDVLVTGGDPLTLSTPALRRIIEALCAIPHIRTVRIGSKIPAFNPFRIIEDPDLHDLLRETCEGGVAVYLMCHFDHPRELTDAAREAVRQMASLGVQSLNQCPITAGINDDVDTLTALFQATTEAGCPQYYMFQCRPTSGNMAFSVPVVRAFQAIDEARARVSGLSRRVRFCMSHASGKVEVIGIDADRIFARYHRAKSPADEGRVLILRRDEHAYWLDQLEPAE